MFQEKCTLNWTDFDASTSKTFKDLLTDQDFTDVTLSCDDEKQIKAHKVILSASSPVMKRILKYNPHQNPLIYLKGVKFEDLQNMVQFIYMGEAEVKQIHLERFMSLTQEFEVNGLYVEQVAHIPTTISLPDQQLNELDETMITGEIKQEEDMKKVKKAKKLKKSRKSSHVENEVVDALYKIRTCKLKVYNHLYVTLKFIISHYISSKAKSKCEIFICIYIQKI